MRWDDQSPVVWLQMCWQPCIHSGHIKKSVLIFTHASSSLGDCLVRLKLRPLLVYLLSEGSSFLWNTFWICMHDSTLVCIVLSEAIGELHSCSKASFFLVLVIWFLSLVIFCSHFIILAETFTEKMCDRYGIIIQSPVIIRGKCWTNKMSYKKKNYVWVTWVGNQLKMLVF